MARPLRVDFPGAIHHVGTRGNSDDAIVLDDHDRQKLVRLIAVVCDRYEMDCGGWCLMTNHYHLIVRSRTGNLSRMMATLNGQFARWLNVRYRRRGHRFGERFFNRVLDHAGYRREVARYVPLNPVRAGMVSVPEAWGWSSYAAQAGLGPALSFVSPFVVNEWFDGNTAAYRAWVLSMGSTQSACLEALFEAHPRIDAIRAALHPHQIPLDAVAEFLGTSVLALRSELRVTR